MCEPCCWHTQALNVSQVERVADDLHARFPETRGPDIGIEAVG
jgi:hypothetical protein